MKKCLKCGGTEYYSDGRCAHCRRASNRARYAINPHSKRKRALRWSEANKERRRLTNRIWRETHREHVKQKMESWYKENRILVLQNKKEFYLTKSSEIRKKRKEYYRKNPEKSKLSSLKWKKKNPDKMKRDALLRKYGITLETYQSMLKEQQGVCHLCGKPETRIVGGTPARLSVDHCHKTNRVRKLLCQRCNRLIGGAGENPDLLRRMADYLEEHSDDGSPLL